jgi:hypothetical protein
MAQCRAFPCHTIETPERMRRRSPPVRFEKGKSLTRGPVNRRKYERLEDIGWTRGLGVNLSILIIFEGKFF